MNFEKLIEQLTEIELARVAELIDTLREGGDGRQNLGSAR